MLKNRLKTMARKRLIRVNKTRSAEIADSTREMLDGLSKVQDVTQTMREFNKLDYEEPKEYKPDDIVKLRQKVLGVSQGVFAYVCNINVNTLQKWEQGKRSPSHSVYRLFQLFEKYQKHGLDLFKKQHV